MPNSRFTCGIVVPVRDEEKALLKTVPALLAATQEERARIIWVCNGCSDNSANVIRRLADKDCEVVDIETPGKTLALQVGDEMLNNDHLFPRLYLDADTWLRPGDVSRLMDPLRRGAADLVAATHAFDFSNSSFLSVEMARCWLALPFAQNAGFLGAVAVSATGRESWKEWPSIIADDMFLAGIVRSERQIMNPNAIATTWSPSTFSDWVAMRSRWLRGERQVVALGLSLPSPPSQRTKLIKMLFDPRTSIGSFAFCLARLLAIPLSRKNSKVSWKPAR